MAYRIKIEPQGKTLTTNGKETIKAALEREGFYFPVTAAAQASVPTAGLNF